MAQAARDYSSYDRYSRYSTASANAAYKRNASAAQPKKAPRRNIRVLPGKGESSRRAQPLSLFAVRGFKAVIAIVAVLAVVCSVRVWLSVSTVEALQSTSAIQSQIEEARAAGNDLEIKHSALANPTRIQKKAAALGMSAPKTTERIKVALPAETKTFKNGTISISSTVKSIKNSVVKSKK